MRSLVIPPPINPKETVRVIAPSGDIRDWERLEQGLQVWRDRGYTVKIPPDMNQPWGYLAGSDRHRYQQLLEAWNDPECGAIICARGGYGSTRLLEILNWQDLQSHPKWLIGFSDVTALQWGLAANKQIGSFHASVASTLGNQPPESIEKFFGWLEGKIDSVSLSGMGWGGGKAQGILLSGNLNVATHLIGTPLCPDMENVILAFEDVAEPPYKVDRMLTHWRLSGLLHKVKGVALGRFSQSEVSTPTLGMEEVWRDRLQSLEIPLVVNLPFGHDGINMPLCNGCIAELDGDAGILSYER
ncbi:LD-carboxypeptidase [Tumidithrix elongata RA019]|uniref:LD-carboxypeptidase n=1 Tax=Tumidithrix elongata BACA0141 TaxID=2716417 RepID=A0AAW9Q177_9CYAN|nr:LD-carboxypeptidase [Tumidithrix elongata RA019]